MLDISAATNQPRTAIGYTADKKMILFVCEGRNMTEGVSGLTTADVAKVMKDLGCTEALNLDGGGSSCMGAAFPFSIGKRLEAGESRLRLTYDALKRGLQLTFFAIFIQHFYPYVLSNPQDLRSWLLAICCFIVLFPMFMQCCSC